MCYQGKCFVCIPVEHGCLVFAILSAIATGIALLASIVLGILTTTGAVFASQYVKHEYDYSSYPWNPQPQPVAIAVAAINIVACIVILVVGIASLIAFIFSVLLCNGICKRRAGPVKAYFVYGVTITVLAVLAAVGELVADGPEEIGIGALIGCVIYALFLVLVYQTYCKLRDGAVFKDHIRLVENES